MKLTALTITLLLSMYSGYSQKKDSLVAPWWVEKFTVSFGFFVPINDTRVQVGVNGSASNGTEIDFKKDLGFDAALTTFMAGFEWRISRRSRISLGYYRLNRSNTHKLDRDITFDSVTYQSQASVNAFINNNIWVFSYGYAIIEKPTYEFGVSIGAHTVGTTAGISLNTASSSTSASTDFGFTAPLPNLGIWGGYAFSKRFAANVDFGYLSLTINNIKGQLIVYDVIATYKLLEQLNLSLGYSGLNTKVTVTRKNVAGDFKWNYNGPFFCASFAFGKKSWTHSKE